VILKDGKVAGEFCPKYKVLPGNVVKKLLKAIQDAEAVYVVQRRMCAWWAGYHARPAHQDALCSIAFS